MRSGSTMQPFPGCASGKPRVPHSSLEVAGILDTVQETPLSQEGQGKPRPGGWCFAWGHIKEDLMIWNKINNPWGWGQLENALC